MSIVDSPVLTAVTGGVDTHVDFHVAAALDHIGGLLGVEAFDVSDAGCRVWSGPLAAPGVCRCGWVMGW